MPKMDCKAFNITHDRSRHPRISIDLGSNEPGMTLQYREDGKLVWRDVLKDGQVIKSPVDIDALPFGVYRLV